MSKSLPGFQPVFFYSFYLMILWIVLGFFDCGHLNYVIGNYCWCMYCSMVVLDRGHLNDVMVCGTYIPAIFLFYFFCWGVVIADSVLGYAWLPK